MGKILIARVILAASCEEMVKIVLVCDECPRTSLLAAV